MVMLMSDGRGKVYFLSAMSRTATTHLGRNAIPDVQPMPAASGGQTSTVQTQEH